jgi:hypothetical protein
VKRAVGLLWEDRGARLDFPLSNGHVDRTDAVLSIDSPDLALGGSRLDRSHANSWDDEEVGLWVLGWLCGNGLLSCFRALSVRRIALEAGACRRFERFAAWLLEVATVRGVAAYSSKKPEAEGDTDSVPARRHRPFFNSSTAVRLGAS